MKKINFSLFFFLFVFIFFQNKSFGQSPSALGQEVVLEVSTVTSKNYNEVKSALSGMAGITLLAYCEENKCFLLSYNPSTIESTDYIEKTVQQLHPSYKTKIKRNITVNEMIGSCKSFALSDGAFEAR